MRFKTILPILILSILIPATANAFDPFDPGFIISDTQMRDYGSMSRSDIQIFLQENRSYLAGYTTTDATGMPKRASDIIYEAALKSRISPKSLLVLLQKEQSLVTDSSPSQKQLDWATGYAVCDSCTTNDSRIQRWRGFGKQVNSASLQLIDYMDNPYDYNFRPGNTYTIANTNKPAQDVTIKNLATAALYNYTPHVYNGNYNFYNLYSNWFGQEFFPSGTLVKSTLMDTYYLIQDGQKRRFKNKTVMLSRVDPDSAVPLSPEDISEYPNGPLISFPNYSLLKSGATTYLVDYDSIRPFDSDATFRYFGYHPDEVITVSSADLVGYTVGEKITRDLAAPQGVIFQVPELATNYLLKDNTLYPIINPLIIEANYKTLPKEKHDIEDLKKFTVANLPLTFSDGTLLQETDGGKIYVMENGKKRRIKNIGAFLAMGYKKENLVKIDLLTSLSLPNGSSFDITNQASQTTSAVAGETISAVKEPKVQETAVTPTTAQPTVSPSQPTVSESYSYDTTSVKNLFETKVPVYLVAEYPSGKILAGKNIDTVRSIASLTKLMTAYTSLKQGFDFAETTTYYHSRHANYGNPLKLTEGEQVKNSDLFNAMLVASVNPVSRMVAQNNISEESFIIKMNNIVQSWGLSQTSFADVSGLDEKNKSTARNLLKIFSTVLDKPEIKTALGDQEYSLKKISTADNETYSLKNTNHLILESQPGYKVLAGKTGYTDEARSVLVQLIKDTSSGKQFVVITMGNEDYWHRFDEPGRLAEWTTKTF